MNISEPKTEHAIPAIWRQAFRPLFLMGSIFAILSMATWALWLTGKVSFSPYGGMYFWHGHEMLFGFVSAIIVGFLLTAVQNWTGLRATHGSSLIVLFSLWLAGRLLIVFNPLSIQWLTAIIDASFLLLAAVFMGKLVLKVKQYRNLIFVPILALLVMGNLLTHWSVLAQQPEYYRWGTYTTVMTITLIISIIAGRIFPMFTANGTNTKKVANLEWLEKVVIGLTLILALLFLTNLSSYLPKMVMAVTFGLAAVCHTIRALRWRPQVTFGTPLVWSLHLAYWFVPASLALFAMHFAGGNISPSTALHGLTAGAISSLILAMIARISLGHTGRPLQPRRTMTFAFMMIILAGISRVSVEYLQEFTSANLYVVAAILWVFAYLLYVLGYWKILTSPRPDGRLG
ncbi:NnrS family protein [Aliiglaciecola sp. 3_MG-2023]|uniref:NnrS family protein n=1 Tax=Aliiglaciecola sp. 3_MG-2023 TaxID=3062644 RepID=UPI0026E11FD2|nr:NnrS family protein [Aliiglaciecola sp. 3_MG-2023]MDO6694830.1 NnrS family protein [Aliiglaciecola sp. 3_MG-2023]